METEIPAINTGKNNDLAKICHKLAHPDVKVRSRAIKDAGKFIANNKMTNPSMRKLGIAIYYYIWSTDMQITQRQVSVKISQLHKMFNDHRKSFLYFRSLFFALAQNWSNIDKFRSDKILLFVRILIAELLDFIHESSYDTTLLKQFSKLIQDPDGISSEKAAGLTLHVIEVFIPEFKATIGENLISPESARHILTPFIKLAMRSNSRIIKHIHSNVLSKLNEIFISTRFLKPMAKKIGVNSNKLARRHMEKTINFYMKKNENIQIIVDKPVENLQSVLKNGYNNDNGKSKRLKVVFNLKNNKITPFYKNQPPSMISAVTESVC